MARLAELPLKRVAQFSTDGDPALMRRTGIGLYGLMWLSFVKGALLATLIGRLIR